MATLLVEDAVFQTHLVPAGHPERPERLAAVHQALSGESFDGLIRHGATQGEHEALLTVHPREHVDRIRSAASAGMMVALDPDTFVCPDSYDVALAAVGSACFAVDQVMTGRVANAFAALRPPGHHAEPDRAMGFCLFGNAAIAARFAQRHHGAEKVAIVDWDVHHGNGTQATFWEDPSVLYASTHQMPLFPGTGAADETGVGNIVNAPLAPGDGMPAFRAAFEGAILPALRDFAPDLVIISAGFDAHERDPLANINLHARDFAWATREVMGIAEECCQGRIVSLLEGGYDLTALADSSAAHVRALMSG